MCVQVRTLLIRVLLAFHSFCYHVVDDWFDANSLECFKFLDAKVNISWVEAQLECEKVGGYLAEPRVER